MQFLLFREREREREYTFLLFLREFCFCVYVCVFFHNVKEGLLHDGDDVGIISNGIGLPLNPDSCLHDDIVLLRHLVYKN